MSTMILIDQTDKTPLGQLLGSTTDPVIEIKDEAGAVVAKIFLQTLEGRDVCHEHVMMAEAEINERVYRLFNLTPDEVALLKREVEH